MAYTLGIDVGMSYTAAAVTREGPAGRGEPEPVALGARSAATPSVVFLGEDGQLLVGEGAERRALTDPDRVAREFKRRLGDAVPIVVGGRSCSAEGLTAAVVRYVVDRVAEREGDPAEAVAVTHPASWGTYKQSLLRSALVDVGLPDVVFVSEPAAAAAHYASRAAVPAGAAVAVYDLGGGTFDAAVVRKTESSYEVLGTPVGLERLGGVDFDEAVFQHVREGAGLSELRPADLDPADPDVLAAMVRVRRECTEAKEALSSDTEATIPVLLPGRQTRVRLVRSELEDMIRGPLEETLHALQAAVRAAGVRPEDLAAVLLVGGSSRIPLVAQLLSAELGRPVAVDADPKATIALGAARMAADALALAPVAAGEQTEVVPADHLEPVTLASRRVVAPLGARAGATSHRRPAPRRRRAASLSAATVLFAVLAGSALASRAEAPGTSAADDSTAAAGKSSVTSTSAKGKGAGGPAGRAGNGTGTGGVAAPSASPGGTVGGTAGVNGATTSGSGGSGGSSGSSAPGGGRPATPSSPAGTPTASPTATPSAGATQTPAPAATPSVPAATPPSGSTPPPATSSTTPPPSTPSATTPPGSSGSGGSPSSPSPTTQPSTPTTPTSPPDPGTGSGGSGSTTDPATPSPTTEPTQDPPAAGTESTPSPAATESSAAADTVPADTTAAAGATG